MRYTIILLAPLLAVLALACDGGGEDAQPTSTAPPAPTATVLAATPAATAEPEVQRLAYVDGDGNVWLVNADGSDRRQLLQGDRCPHAMLTWSPKGDQLACIGAENRGVVVVDTDGRVLNEIEHARGFGWSPTGSYMLYGVASPASPQPAPPAEPTITTTFFLADAAGNVIEEVGGFGYWSLDGSSFVYVEDSGELVMYDVLAREGRLLAEGVDTVGPWSPDGSSFLYVEDSGELVMYDVLAREGRGLGEGIDTVGRWVLGGEAILAQSNVRECDKFCLYDVSLLDVKSGRLTRVPALDREGVEAGPRSYRLSPDGSKAVFMTRDRTMAILDFLTLKVTRIEGATRRYPGDGAPGHPHLAFSRDDSQIVWADVVVPDNLLPDMTIYRVRSDGTGLTEVAKLPALMVEFSPDLQQVAYLALGGEVGVPATLWTANIDGSSAIEIGPVTSAFAWQPQP